MKKIILSLVSVLALTGSANAALLGKYQFTDGSASVSASDGEMSFGPFTRQGALTLVSSTDVFNTSGWTSSATRDTSQYVQFAFSTISTAVQIDSITFSYLSTKDNGAGNNGGPVQGSMEIWVAGNLTRTVNYTLNNSGKQVNDFNPGECSSVTANNGETVSVRFYGWAAENAAGTLRFDDVTVNGLTGVTAVPEPINVALALFGCTFAGIDLGRKFLKKKA